MGLLGDYFGAVARIVKYYNSIRPIRLNSLVFIEIAFIEAGFKFVHDARGRYQAPVPQLDKYPSRTTSCLCATEDCLPQVDYTAHTKAYPP